jgi:hypothetical protein
MTIIDSDNFLDYENLPIFGNVYDDLCHLLDSNSNILVDTNIIIYQLNWHGGMGSALTVYLQNAYYMHQLNKNIITLPMFSLNGDIFKYHEPSLNNSFFLFFKYKHNINLHNSKIYFCHSKVHPNLTKYNICHDFFTNQIYDESNTKYIEYFHNNFELKIGQNIFTFIRSIKSLNKPLIGIHLRSLAQRIEHQDCYPIHMRNRTINDILLNLKTKLDESYNDYDIFLATDCNLYIENVKQVFTNVYYLDNICRINNELNSVPQLSEYTGFKLGSDILYDCLALSLCDKTYITYSNIPFIIKFVNSDGAKLEYY